MSARPAQPPQRSRSTTIIPVTVVADRPSSPQPSHASVTTPVSKPRSVRPAIAHLAVSRRRQIMWTSVIGAMVVILIGWAAAVRWEIAGAQRPSRILSDLTNILHSNPLKSTTKTSPSSPEIRRLEQQVFPQLSQ